jgi:hypothetical protein
MMLAWRYDWSNGAARVPTYFVRDNDGATETVIMFRILRLTIIC